jgi:hypothetical protein
MNKITGLMTITASSAFKENIMAKGTKIPTILIKS